jgi:hypothetical protein
MKKIKSNKELKTDVFIAYLLICLFINNKLKY